MDSAQLVAAVAGVIGGLSGLAALVKVLLVGRAEASRLRASSAPDISEGWSQLVEDLRIQLDSNKETMRLLTDSRDECRRDRELLHGEIEKLKQRVARLSTEVRAS